MTFKEFLAQPKYKGLRLKVQTEEDMEVDGPDMVFAPRGEVIHFAKEAYNAGAAEGQKIGHLEGYDIGWKDGYQDGRPPP